MTDFLPYPNIDPVAFSLGPLDIRWYSLAYMAAFILGWRYCMRLARLDKDIRPNDKDIDDLLFWIMAGVIAGGRIGYVLFYNFTTYLENPLDILKVWHGGMSFHGGLLGVIVVILAFSFKRGISPFRLGDIVSCATPVGLFFGRIANFINGELYGRVTDSPLGMIFPHGGSQPRHPSQLYEAFFEGLVLFLILLWLVRKPTIRHKEGFIFGTLMSGYGLARFGIEFFRAPDAHIGFLTFGMSMGQILSLPMILSGAILMVLAWQGKTVSKAKTSKES